MKINASKNIEIFDEVIKRIIMRVRRPWTDNDENAHTAIHSTSYVASRIFLLIYRAILKLFKDLWELLAFFAFLYKNYVVSNELKYSSVTREFKKIYFSLINS